jgi:hypothetical protein
LSKVFLIYIGQEFKISKKETPVEEILECLFNMKELRDLTTLKEIEICKFKIIYSNLLSFSLSHLKLGNGYYNLEVKTIFKILYQIYFLKKYFY